MNEDDIRQIQEEYEVTLTGVPKAVNIIELAKRYGTEHSGSFVNGVLDAVLAEARS